MTFRGAVASVGARLGSFSIDAVVVLLLAAAVAVPTQSVALTSVVAFEVVVALVVWEARTGLTVGHAALRLRTARDDRPWSPGAGRELARAAMVGAGTLLGVVGGWVVVGSGGLDRTGRGRTWADRAAKTVVVRVADVSQPAAVGRATAGQAGFELGGQTDGTALAVTQAHQEPRALPARQPGTLPRPVVPGPADPSAARPRRMMVGLPPAGPSTAPVAPRPVVPRPVPSPGAQLPAAPGSQPPSAPSGARLSAAPPAVPAPPAVSGTSALPPVLPGPPAAERRAWPRAVPQTAAQLAAPTPAATPLTRPDVTVLLVLDTGQRDQLQFGASVVLGRDPVPQVPGDRVVAVHDDAGTVSKNHLRVEYAPDGVWLTDLGSTNGTQLLTDSLATPLVPGARTRIDGVVRVAVGHRMLLVSYLVRGGRP